MNNPRLSTAILVQAEMEPWEIFNIALHQLLFFDGKGTSLADVRTIEKEDEEDGKGRHYIVTDPGEKLPAIMAVYYRPEGEMITEQEAQEEFRSSCTEPDCKAHRHPPCHLLVGFSTEFSYSDHRGWNAGDVHSAMVWAVSGYLDGRKIPWMWQSNVLGSNYEGCDDLDKLPAFVNNMRNGSVPGGVERAVAMEILRRMGFAGDK